MVKKWLGLGAGLLSCAIAAPAAANTINVTSWQDNPAVDGQCSLREAIVASNLGSTIDTCVASAGGNTIVLSEGTYYMKPLALGPVGVVSYIHLKGRGHKQTIIQVDPSESASTSPGVFSVNTGSGHLYISGVQFTKFRSRVLNISAGARVSLFFSKLIKNNGNFLSSGSCIKNFGIVHIANSEISECDGTTGGALQNSGTAVIEYSTFLRNSGERGGAIYNQTGANLYVNSSTLGRNETTVYGAALQNGGNAYIASSTIAYNRTDLDSGGVSCTSSATMCSAIQNFSPGYIELSGSVVAHNTASSGQTKPNCIGSPSSTGGNLLGEATSTACDVVTLPGALPNLSPQDAKLNNSSGDPLWYGGVGRTYMPTSTSPLLNQLAGSSSPCGLPDQRGLRRYTGSCDIGSVERASALLVVGNTTLSSGDSVLKGLLENLGYTVTVELATSTSSGSATGKRVVVISESVTSTDVNTKFRDVSTGTVVLENALFDDMRMAGPTNNTDYGVSNDFAINLLTGPITNKFGALGFLTTTTSSVSQTWGVPNVNAQREGTLNSSNSRYGLFSYYPGDIMVPNTHSAPGYRVGAFATNAAMGALTAGGRELLQEAILFASK
jgi:CSLREA domain-containing protein